MKRFLDSTSAVLCTLWLLGGTATALPVRHSVEYTADRDVPAAAMDDVDSRQPLPSKVLADTAWIADWSFDGAGGGCNATGWVKLDNRIRNDGSNYWQVGSRFDGTGGITGRAAYLSKHNLCWPVPDGYGNDWDFSIICKYRGTGSTLSCQFLSDSEPNYDLVTVEADSAGVSELRVDYAVDPGATSSAPYRVQLLSYTGIQSAGLVTGLVLPDFGVPGVTHEVYLRFSSDDAGSDEDGLYADHFGAGLVVDNISIAGGLSYTENFEGALDPNVVLANTANAQPFGEWARLFQHITDNDPCAENTTCAWLWSDPLTPARFPSMSFGPSGVVVRNWLDDIIVSPWVNLGSPSALTVLRWRRNPAQNSAQSCITQNWSVRIRRRVDNTDTPLPGDSVDCVGAWAHASSWNTFNSFKWTTNTWDITSYIGSGASQVQVRFRTADTQLGYLFGDPPPGTWNPGPGPFIDRIRIGRVSYSGPTFSWPVPSYYSAGDGFPSVQVASVPAQEFAPTTDRFGTIDFAPASVSLESHGPGEPWRYNLPDSIYVQVQDVRGAGVTSVGVYAAIVAGPHAGKVPPPWSAGPSGFFYVPADTVRDFRGVVQPGYWFVDLDDTYFRGGDVLDYFWAATDAAGGFTSLPAGLTAVPASIAAAQQATGGILEVGYLPSIDWDPGYLARIAAHPTGKIDPTPAELANSRQRACILYYCQSPGARRSGPARRTAFMYTLDQLGYRNLYDVYWQTTEFFNYSTPLAGRATPPQATGYALIVQDAGSLYGNLLIPPGELREGVVDQQTWYQEWLAQAKTSESGRAALWLVGENFVDDAVYYNDPLVLTDMGVTRVSASQTLLPWPSIVGQGTCTWAQGGTTDFTDDRLTLDAYGCQTHLNDGMGATGTAIVTHRYALGATTGDGAGVVNANPSAGWNSILMSFAWETLLEMPNEPPGNRRADLMAEILDGVLSDSCKASAQPTDLPPRDTALPPVTALHGNAPNPFNPLTTIRFDLARSGSVQLVIYDISGRRVRTLIDAPLEAGWDHRVTWDGVDEAGRRVASGIYFCRLTAAEIRATRKLVVMK